MHMSQHEVLERIRVVLVEPSHPGNIGAAARALKTMGLGRLALVNPKRFPDPQAEWRAAGAQDVLESIAVYQSVAAAIADCTWVVGTSTRLRRIPWPVKPAAECAADILAQPSGSQVAILFGRETSGLTNDELQQCHCHLQIPANPDYPSLNLAMAVQVVAYELYRQASARTVAELEVWDRPLAPMSHLEALFDHLEAVLIAGRFLDSGSPGQTMTRLRRLFTRVALDETEVQMLRGILTALAPDDGPARTTGSPANSGSI
jgi:tRNA (cytidine32/uridine32-2'-O)-methyltransferase